MEDARIIDLYWSRSEVAIDETSAKYGKYCYTIAYNILANAEDSDESVNDTYLAAWNSMPPSVHLFCHLSWGKSPAGSPSISGEHGMPKSAAAVKSFWPWMNCRTVYLLVQMLSKQSKQQNWEKRLIVS